MNDVTGEYATVDVADTGVSVVVRKPSLSGSDTTDVAAFSWVDGVEVERWARDYADAINRAHFGRNEPS